MDAFDAPAACRKISSRLPRQTGSGGQEVESSARKWSIPANNSLGGGGIWNPQPRLLLPAKPQTILRFLSAPHHSSRLFFFFSHSENHWLKPNHVIEVLCFSLCLSYLITSTDLDVNVAPCHLFLHCTLVSPPFWMNS